MYVCLCNPTTDLQIEDEAVSSSSIQELKNKLSICQGCGSCANEIEHLYNKVHKNSSMQPSRQAAG